MLNWLIDIIIPHYCCSCGKIGGLLCEYCKYDIISDQSMQCLACLRPVGRQGDVCRGCRVFYTRGWFVGLHKNTLRQIITAYKFKRAKAAATVLARLLHETLPQLPTGTLVACVPTVATHVRERGYDHAVLLAKEFARLRGITYHNPLFRTANTRQRGATRGVRIRQAKAAFLANNAKPALYLLIDDVSTTGATINYAAKALKDNGAKEVWVAAVTREPLD